MLVARACAWSHYTRCVNLIETLGVRDRRPPGRNAGGEPRGRGGRRRLRDAGLEPRFHEFGLLGYEAEEPELEIDGERWDAGPCIYSNPTGGTVEGRVRRLGTHSIGGFFLEADVFAVEDERRHVSSPAC